ncbi:DUF4166 domain-containing protein [Paracidovorax valerianellae]|uniref:DUF4166 domain-containing protein n=1 Tax=Paracidovorax valerianellae TaxID=187868 RepID=A0A1G6ZHG4_9BURK|nr:DUF4166 domain-containing protein [Paracidovorax valerianellae]MDA8444315.1 DUF4166 domain-containing protein [Paracidovorax valerianellae]SDE02069.1 protein of unknown function [Paracidovorax valerianellae]
MKTVAHLPLPLAKDTAEPLDLASFVSPSQWLQLSPAIRRRFAANHADACYHGTLALRRSGMGRWFAWASQRFGGPLLNVDEDSVPAQVRVFCNAQGGVVWERHLCLPGDRDSSVVRSTKMRGPQGGLQERTSSGLSMDLDVAVEEGALVFYSRRYFLALGPFCCPIPAWLTPGRCRVEHRDEGRGTFRFTLEMVHPFWGCTFFQTGVFTDPEESLS